MRIKPSNILPAWLILFTLGHFSHDLLTALLTPLLPFIHDEFGLDYTRTGLLLSVFSITYGLSQLPSGWLADRLGPRVLMAASICGVAAGGVIIGLSPNYILLLIGLGLMGILGSGYHPAAVPLVASTMDFTKRGRAIGIHAIGGSASFFIAPFFAVACAVAWGWRSAFLLLAIPTLIFGIFLYFKMSGFKPYQYSARETQNSIPTQGAIKQSGLYSFITLSSVVTVVTTTIIAFIPLFMAANFGYGPEAAGLMLAVIYLTGIFASPLAGFMSDRLGRIPILIGAGLVLLPVLYLMSQVSDGWHIYLLLIILGGIIAFSQNSSESYIVGHVSREKCSSVLGTFYFISMAGVGVLSPILGALIDARNFTFSFILLGSLVATVSLLYLVWYWMRNRGTINNSR